MINTENFDEGDTQVASPGEFKTIKETIIYKIVKHIVYNGEIYLSRKDVLGLIDEMQLDTGWQEGRTLEELKKRING